MPAASRLAAAAPAAGLNDPLRFTEITEMIAAELHD
jgi:hypothetical protein